MVSLGLRHVLAAAALVTSPFAWGCAHNAALPPADSSTGQSFAQTTTTSGPATAVRGDVVVSSELLRACNVDLGNAQTAPKFDFDRSDLRASDRSVLDQVARCVTSGPLKGRALHLVGRADPRGEQEYNMALGSSRAASVGQYLQSLGVPGTEISQSSRGALDASGTSEATWELDRRVDID
jgi:peptidoglycan-associated lipoprotein